jgi:hypothetical protein
MPSVTGDLKYLNTLLGGGTQGRMGCGRGQRKEGRFWGGPDEGGGVLL